MDDLAVWLQQQLDEDWQVAQLAAPGPWRFDGNPSCVVVAGDGRSISASAWNCEPPVNAANAEHIARWDPARVLREVEAKRRLLAELRRVTAALTVEANEHAVERLAGMAASLETAVRIHAQAYDDRPGYREEWRP